MNWNFCNYKNILFQRLIAADEDSNNIIKQEINILVSFQKLLHSLFEYVVHSPSYRHGLMWRLSQPRHIYTDNLLSPGPPWTTEGTVGRVRWPIITIHVTCHFFSMRLHACPLFDHICAVYHEQFRVNPVSLSEVPWSSWISMTYFHKWSI
jgi:hypothetical protein